MRFASVFILSGFLVLLSGMGEARDQGVPRPQEPRLAQQQDTNEVLALLAKADRPMPGGNGSRVNGRTVREEFIGPALALSRKLHWPRGEALALFLGSIALEQDGADGAARARLDSAVRMSGVLPLHERGLWLQHAALFEAVGEMDLDRADSLAVASLDCLSGGEWPQDHAASLEAQARVALFKRDWMNAILKYYRTIDRAEACQAGPTLAIAYEKMGMIMHELGDMNKAILYFRRSTHLSDSLGLTFRAYMGYFNWGSALLEVGRPDEALPLLRKAKAMASSPAMPAGRAGQVLPYEAEALRRMGRVDEAVAVLPPQGPGPEAPRMLLARGGVALARQRYAEAAVYCRQALPKGRALYGEQRLAMQACECLMNADRGLGNMDQALEWNIRAQQWKDTINYAREANAAVRFMAEREYGRRMLADSLAHASEMALRTAEAGHQRKLRNGAYAVGMVLGGLALLLMLQRRRIQKALLRSDELLLNILPAEVAHELKTKGEADARQIDEATILFTDFKDFTAISEQLTARELVDELNACFKAFDHIITARGIEKIKTIGDAYMCAGGLADTQGPAPVQVVHAALEMQAFMVERKAVRALHGLPAFDMRVGIHTGPVVAGIVGVKKFQYDIWGDTVNIASRMESAGEIGKVNISASTHLALKHAPGLAFEERGRVRVKGKGELEMYFVQRSGGRGDGGPDDTAMRPGAWSSFRPLLRSNG
jgi:adenylate cyclase